MGKVGCGDAFGGEDLCSNSYYTVILFAEHVFSYFSTFYVLDFTNGVWIGNQTNHIWRRRIKM